MSENVIYKNMGANVWFMRTWGKLSNNYENTGQMNDLWEYRKVKIMIYDDPGNV